MLITVDNREYVRLNEILEFYGNLPDCTCEVTTLTTGDFIFTDNNGSVCFEFKTVEDFIASIKDKRVFNQSISMYEEFDYHYVIIVGSDLDRENAFVTEGLKEDNYYTAIAKINTYSTVITVHDNELAYNMMKWEAEKCLEDNFVYKRLPIKSPNPAQNLLLMCKDIGDETATLLKEELNIYSFHDLTRISYDDLIRIRGIGDKTATKILEYIGGELQIK